MGSVTADNLSHTASQPQVKRLVDWNCDVLSRLLKQVVAHRMSSGKSTWGNGEEEPVLPQTEGAIALDEVTDTIRLPAFVFQRKPVDPSTVQLPPAAEAQLKEYVSALGNAYHSNPFHCLQHASQVTTALTKLLSRIVVSQLPQIEEGEDIDDEEDIADGKKEEEIARAIAPHLFDHTFGINGDPLTQFTLVLSALIHEVDHCGMNNPDIVRTSPEAAALYKNTAVIEQRSVDKAWKKLMEPAFTDLRQCIYGNDVELMRFRQVMVNAVIATNVEDPQLQTLRMKRWEKTFSHQVAKTPEDVHRGATIVIEHLMQASDSFHCMQPWIVYEKWCFRDFEERYAAFKRGTSEEDPSLTWYKKELEYFDNYIIPLTMELKDCEAFVVSNDEYLMYALQNRQLLASKGPDMVPIFMSKIQTKHTSSNDELVANPLSSTPQILAPIPTPLEERKQAISRQTRRLVDWNSEMLQHMLMAIVAKRNAANILVDSNVEPMVLGDGSYVDEIAEIIAFPAFDENTSPDKLDIESVELGSEVVSQLHDFVSLIASKYLDNPFHGFDRASQVCMTSRKQLSRMMTNNVVQPQVNGNHPVDIYQKTYGISQDPLAQFAVVFAALVCDCDHQGVPNSHVVNAKSKWNNRCINQQSALDTAWSCLMMPQFNAFRSCIVGDKSGMKRFKQLLLNLCLTTDINDSEIPSMQKDRWHKAFIEGKNDLSVENKNRRATCVLELIMQTSDIFHTLSNWHLYVKWTERHFGEVYKAYRAGKLAQDPCIFWYKCELLFFDQHVITSAKLLKDCGALEASSEEQLSFALSNRQQWAAKGGNLVASMVTRYMGQEIEKVRAKRSHRRMSLSAKQA
ncbi:MAG: hypothetical protein SGILL_002870 [Bacillariaceae sp.]